MVLSLLSPSAEAALIAAQPPNIVLIVADDMGYTDLGCYGPRGYQTPNIDRLAREGRRFTNFHVAQSVCSASRAAILTGCYPNRIGIHGALFPKSRHGLSAAETTIADMLKQRGYATGMVGKWHLGDHTSFLPLRHGFDEFFGLPYSHDMWPAGNGGRPSSNPPLPLIEQERVIKTIDSADDQRELTRLFTERAVSFIERQKGGPFFLYVAHTMPHVPLFVSDRFKGKSERGIYGDVMIELDWSVGEILNKLDSAGLADNTLVIFMSDNGPWLCFGTHSGKSGALREGKGTSFEGGLRVPCLMRWPGKIRRQTTCHTMLMSIDLLPTIARQVGARLPENPIDGLDVWPIVSRERHARNPHAAYYFYHENNQLQAVMSGDGRWKLMLPHTYRTLAGGPGGVGGKGARYVNFILYRPTLYHISRDVEESKDVSAVYPEVMQKLLKQVTAARDELGDSLKSKDGCGVRPAGRVPDSSSP
jgi:arylsulfatase